MPKLITVRSTKIHDRVVLYELHPDHPKGKGWVIGNGKPVQVAHTNQVNRLIGSRLLEIVEQVPDVQARPVLSEESTQQKAAPKKQPKVGKSEQSKVDEVKA